MKSSALVVSGRTGPLYRPAQTRPETWYWPAAATVLLAGLGATVARFAPAPWAGIGTSLIGQVVGLFLGIKWLDELWKRRFDRDLVFKPLEYARLVETIASAKRDFVIYSTFSYLFSQKHIAREGGPGAPILPAGKLWDDLKANLLRRLSADSAFQVSILLLNPYSAAAQQRQNERRDDDILGGMKENLWQLDRFLSQLDVKTRRRIRVGVSTLTPRFQYHRIDDQCVAAFYPPDCAASDPRRSQAHFHLMSAAGQVFEAAFHEAWNSAHSLEQYMLLSIELQRGASSPKDGPFDVKYLNQNDEMYLLSETPELSSRLRAMSPAEIERRSCRVFFDRAAESVEYGYVTEDKHPGILQELKAKYGTVSADATVFILRELRTTRSALSPKSPPLLLRPSRPEVHRQ